ncbi:hypothetical protein [Methylobacterium trifolii]|uniref:Uncharacterized protein n=1 Tax=Methylobacterium trifolii TaxID=1003092 RepID=A0ABQ4U3I0_9HYPH|nr:hypothetical protein [Methylobacterium trifolii]GJE62024.1 hypothetical protein MPOCJGCO_4152 [Methylobacterium trifolii]
MAEQLGFSSRWAPSDKADDWLQQLERSGTEAIRYKLAQHAGGSAGSIAIGTEPYLTKGFAEEWLEWKDRLKREADEAHRERVAWWTKAAAIGAILAAVFTFIGALATVSQAVIAWLALPKP